MFFWNSFWHIALLVRSVYLMSQRKSFSKTLQYFAWIFITTIITSHPREQQGSCVLVTVKGAGLNYTSLLPSNRKQDGMIYIFFAFWKSRWGLFFKSTCSHPAELAAVLHLSLGEVWRNIQVRQNAALASSWESAVGICDIHPLEHFAIPAEGLVRPFSPRATQQSSWVP